MKKEISIALLSPNLRKYSETFIHAQMDRLQGVEWILFGDYLPVKFLKNGDGVELELSKNGGKRKLDQLPGRNPDELRRKRLKKALLQFLKDKTPDVVLAQYGPSGVEIMDICEQAKIPLVVHFHGFDAYRADCLQSYGKNYAQLFRKAAALIAVSGHMARQLQSLGAPETKIHLIPYGIDPGQFSVERKPSPKPLIAAVGRLVPKKNPLGLLAAFVKVRENFPDAQLEILGDGPLREVCEAFIRQNGLENAVKLSGASPPEKVRSLLSEAHCFVLNSCTTRDGDREGTPLSLLEAMAGQVPIVSTIHAGIPELLENGREALLVPEKNIQKLAAGICEVLANPKMADTRAKMARKKVFMKHKEGNYLSHLHQLLERVSQNS